MDNLVILLVHVLCVLPLIVAIGVPAFIIVRLVRYCRSEATRLRKILVVAVSVLAMPFFLVLCLLLVEGLSTGGLSLLNRAFGSDETVTVEAVEQENG